MTTAPDQYEFEGFQHLNGTIVPDVVFDVLMPNLKDGELRVLLYIIRRTYGFKKASDDISISQMVEGITKRNGEVLDRGTGLRKSAVAEALKGLRRKKIIKVIHNTSVARGHEPTTYQLRFKGDAVEEAVAAHDDNTHSLPLSGYADKGLSGYTDKPLSGYADIQQTGLQTTGTNLSNIRMRTRQDFSVDNSESQSTLPHRNGSASGEGDAPSTKPPGSVAASDGGSAPTAAGSGVESVGDVLKRGRGRPPKRAYSEERQQILAYVRDFARDLGDTAPLGSSVTRAYNLYVKSGVHIARFIDAMYQARAKTQERSATIRAKPSDTSPWAPKAKMAYWFALLEDEVGLREGDYQLGTHTPQVRN